MNEEAKILNEEVRETPEAESEIEIEIQKVETEGAPEAKEIEGEAPGGSKKPVSESLRDAWKQVENFGQTLGAALQDRGNVVTLRINDEALHHLDMLVEAEITNSRSESAAFLINEGIKANRPLFDRISDITQQIMELREQLREQVQQDIVE
ncbi:MAG: hypothetical protein ACLFTI_05915 [Anaerolineales bacterium]